MMPSISEEKFSLTLNVPKRNRSLDGSYYHVSVNECLGNKVEFFPRLPDESGDSELDIRRVCFSPSVSQCLIAICHRARYIDNFYIYKSDIEVFEPIGVMDSKITGEVWSFNPCWLYKKDIICEWRFMENDWEKFKKILIDAHLACWTSYSYNVKVGEMFLEELRDLFKRSGIEDYP